MHTPVESAEGAIRKTITRSAVQEAIARAKTKRRGSH
jgi:hypothetical protein